MRALKLDHLSQALGNLSIIDAGCGTGSVGIELTKLGARHIDGLDISKGMLDVARKSGAYQQLKVADLTKPLEIPQETYDALTCCGTFTHGHLGPQPLDEFVKVVKTGGVLVATVLDSHWFEKGFEAQFDRLERAGEIKILENNLHNYRKDTGSGRVLILRKV